MSSLLSPKDTPPLLSVTPSVISYSVSLESYSANLSNVSSTIDEQMTTSWFRTYATRVDRSVSGAERRRTPGPTPTVTLGLKETIWKYGPFSDPGHNNWFLCKTSNNTRLRDALGSFFVSLPESTPFRRVEVDVTQRHT